MARTLPIRRNGIFRLQLKHKVLIDDERGDDDDDREREERYSMPMGGFIQLLDREGESSSFAIALQSNCLR